jgi:pyruvate dehydrogenase E2 component (dihydrolipoamide acetyltransferase)
MIVDVIMPKLGIYEDDVELVEWLVDDGTRVAVGDPLFVMETEKVSTEIEADDDGILVREAEPGFKAPVGSRIGYLVSTEGERDELRARLGSGG